MNVGSDFGQVYSFLAAAGRTTDEHNPPLTKVSTHTQLPRSIEGPIRPLSNLFPGRSSKGSRMNPREEFRGVISQSSCSLRSRGADVGPLEVP